MGFSETMGGISGGVRRKDNQDMVWGGNIEDNPMFMRVYLCRIS